SATALDTYDGGNPFTTGAFKLTKAGNSFAGLSPVYDMDGGLDSSDTTYIKMSSLFNSGSGRPDLFIDIPTSLFGSDLNQYVFLYAKLGVQFGGNSTFEEFSHGAAPIQIVGTAATAIAEVSPVAQSPVTQVPTGAIVHDTGTVTLTNPPTGAPPPTGTFTY